MKLEKISCTDVKCLWSGERKSVSGEMYKPTPIDEFCCVESVQKIRDKYEAKKTPEVEAKIRKKLMESCPVSSFSRYDF